MRIGLIGDYANLHGLARGLAQYGHEVYWFLPAAQIPAPRAAALRDSLPATCQHVIPIQASEGQGVRLLGLDQALWEDPALHTRLFTCLSLFHRAWPWHVLHAGSPLALAYLSVYTARVLAVPSVVSCTVTLRSARTRQPFLWDWMTRHASALLVHDVPAAGGPPVQGLDLGHPALGQELTALYTQLGAGGNEGH